MFSAINLYLCCTVMISSCLTSLDIECIGYRLLVSLELLHIPFQLWTTVFVLIYAIINILNRRIVAYSRAHFGQGTGSILMDDVMCTGQEKSIGHCAFNGWSNHDCTHFEDAGVDCNGIFFRFYFYNEKNRNNNKLKRPSSNPNAFLPIANIVLSKVWILVKEICNVWILVKEICKEFHVGRSYS